MPSKNCVVKGCNALKKVIMHRFSLKSPEDFKIWVKRTGNDALLGLEHEQIYQSFVICEQHFEMSSRSPGTKRLKCKSLPTLNLLSTKINKIKIFHVACTLILICLYLYVILW